MKTKHIFSFLAVTALALTSCNDLLDIPQHGVLNNDTYYQTDQEAESAIVACYIQMKGLEYNYVMGKNCLTDDFWAGGGGRNDNAELEQCNEFTFGTDQSFLEGMWSSYYGIIYKANVVLGHVGEDSEAKLRARAEARVFRAWSYIELISMWGTPPLVDHELSPSEYQMPNGKPAELWALVESDLTEAINSGSLTSKKDVNDKTWRITKEYAQALLGKAYLWQGKNVEAGEVLDKVINSGLYALYDNYEDVIAFTAKQNCESMFESVKISDPNNVWNNFSMNQLMLHYRTDKLVDGCCPAAGLASLGWGFLNPQKSLYNDFVDVEGEDGYRLNATLKTYAQMQQMGITIQPGKSIINEGYFMWKWRVLADQTPATGYGYVDDNQPRWMRYAEVLLMAAEANIDIDNAKATNYFNQIRSRAQAPTVSSITLKDLQREKRIELCGEGTRFQDMLRWGIAQEKMKNQGEKCPLLDSNGNVTYVKYNGDDPEKYGFKERHNLLPIPGTEIRLNKSINQNPGWN